MEIIFEPIQITSIIAILVMIGSIAFAYIKKTMMSYALIFANVIVFVLTSTFKITSELGFRPIFLSFENIPQIYTLFTSMFVHANFIHLLGNMFIFVFLGIAFEQRVGWKNFTIIYLLSGICATLSHSIINPGSPIPLVGASGAIFGIMGAFAFSYPKDRIVIPLPLIGFLWTFVARRGIRVIYAVILFALVETFIVISNVQDQTAHYAHIGGLIGGFILAAILLRNKKTHTKEGKTLYYDSFGTQKSEKIKILEFEKLATTPELKAILEKIENEDIPHAREMWIERFLEKAKCPKCGGTLHNSDGKIWCEHCDYKSRY